ncbi:FtsX-like permease family protein [Belnapia rosea]|uniref:Putative ABC transport system permease protein n=1 Tax=Belnapia rosea TaxID=938405 RepID=A0A1G6S5V4_9PROT|nr:FtsX-like permease family protein [Belnapia rosea]SDD11576.1 putative ABC transport system permease protein [Belnapia rosea]
MSRTMLLTSSMLAWNDLRQDLRFSLCLVLSVTAVVGPLLVLFGLRFGVIETMRDELRRNPTTLELRPLTQGRFDAGFFAALRARPGARYVQPTPRFLATILPLAREGAAEDGEAVLADMLPSGAGDPLLAGLTLGDLPEDGVVLSATAAERLRASPGDRVVGRFARVTEERRELVLLPLRVLAVLAQARLARDAALLPPALVEASEDYREGHAAAALGAAGRDRQPGERLHAGFRLFAADIDAVEPLRAWLAAEGVRVQTAASEIALVRRLDRALGLLFGLIAALGGGGAALGLAVSLWANVERKRHELAVLRLIGFRSAAMAAFPLVQAVVVGMLGALAAVGMALAASPLVSWVLRGTVAENLVVYRLPASAQLSVLLLTLLVAALASIGASALAVRVDPALTLRRL